MQTIHVISHTHWDREWYLTYQQFRLKLVHLIDNLLDILEENPDFKHFMLDGQTIVLDDYLQVRPEKEALLRRHIQSGRILIGPWHILPDMFLVSPESHIRNLLEGARTCRRFGPKMPVGYIPDPFGHPGQVPQILKGFGIEWAALWRGVSDLPVELHWQAPDGSTVLLAHLRGGYGNGARLPVHDLEGFTRQVAELRDELAANSSVSDFLVMLGDDHMEPSPLTTAAIAFASKHLAGTQVRHSTLPEYFRRMEDQVSKLKLPLPVLKGELRACDRSHLLPGVLSTRLWIKQRNHASQTLLEKWAEPFSVFAADQPANPGTASERLRAVAPIIRQAWRFVLENNPHDSICGCSIDQVHEEMKPRFDQADQIGEAITLQALQTLSRAVDTQGKDAISALVIFNPHGQAQRDLVETELNIPEGIPAFELCDENGNPVPHEALLSNHEEIADILIRKDGLRDTVGHIVDGRVGGFAILKITVTRKGAVANVEAVLDEGGKADVKAWRQAEEEIGRLEADPTVTHFHLVAHRPRSSKIRFVCPDVPPLGWRTLQVRARVDSGRPGAIEISPWLKPLLPLVMRLAQSKTGARLIARMEAGTKAKPPYAIENEFFRLEADRSDGTLTVTDKRTQTTYRDLNHFVDGGDAGDEYNYSPPGKDAFLSPTDVSVRVFQEELTQRLEIAYGLMLPVELAADRQRRSEKRVRMPILSRVSLVPGVARIDIHTEVDNQALDHRLRVHFPTPFSVDAADHDGHYEVVHRTIDVPEREPDWVEAPRPEVPQRAFTDVSDGRFGLMLANRGLPEVEVIREGNAGGSEIALTLLRCVGWLSRDDLPVRRGHAGPALETPAAQMLGKWSFDYSLIPHAGNWQQAFHQAHAYQAPLRAIQADLHAGELPAQGSFITHTPGQFVISAIKTAENEKGWILRGYNITGEAIDLNLKPWRRFRQAFRVNLAEEARSRIKLEPDGGIRMTVSGHEIVSILFSD